MTVSVLPNEVFCKNTKLNTNSKEKESTAMCSNLWHIKVILYIYQQDFFFKCNTGNVTRYVKLTSMRFSAFVQNAVNVYLVKWIYFDCSF